jgi:hypothetical protein
VLRISNAKQGFHPGWRPHPGETEIGSSMHLEHHRRTQLVDEEEHVNHHRRSTQHAKEGPRWSRQSGEGTRRFQSEKLRPPETLRKTRGASPPGSRAAAHTGVADRGQTTRIAAPGQRPEPCRRASPIGARPAASQRQDNGQSHTRGRRRIVAPGQRPEPPWLRPAPPPLPPERPARLLHHRPAPPGRLDLQHAIVVATEPAPVVSVA